MESFPSRVIARAFRLITEFLERSVTPIILSLFSRRVALAFQKRVASGDSSDAGRIVFLPYGTPACELQHRAFGAVLSQLHFEVEVLNHSRFENEIREYRHWRIQRSPAQFTTFGNLVDHLMSLADGDPVFARGVIDEFVRWAPVESLTESFSIPRAFEEQISTILATAERITDGTSRIVLADTAYANNRSLLTLAVEREIPAWVLNPDGRFLRVSGREDEAFGRTIPISTVLSEIKSDPEVLVKARNYVSQRFRGFSQADMDSPLAFAGSSEVPVSLEGKKILFLHAFRDSNLLPLVDQPGRDRALFRTYIEWAEFVFAELAENPDEWAVRQHPSARHYPGDSEILERLLDRFGISTITRVTGVSTAALLKARLPVFTMAGTIALEAAIFGYQANTGINDPPFPIANPSASRSELSERLRLPADDLVVPVKKEMRDVATLLLYRKMSQDRRIPLAPKRPQPCRESDLCWHRSLLGQQVSLLHYLSQRASIDVGLSMAIDFLDNEMAENQRP